MTTEQRPRSTAQLAADEQHRQRVEEKSLAHDRKCADQHKLYEDRTAILRKAKCLLARPLLPEELDALLPPTSCARTRQRQAKRERQVGQ